MNRLASRLSALVSFHPWMAWAVLPFAVAIVIIGKAISQSAPPNIPAVALATEPLYARGARAKPTLTLALSVEFPTVGAQYLSTPGANSDNTYSATTQYIGYFDSESCYVYNDAPSGLPTGAQRADYKRFDRSKGAAPSHDCGGDSFSGNFMNWASSSAVDILRYGLTGGDRVVDTSDLTVLQRAVLPNTSVSNNFWNGSNFPDKQISAAAARSVLPTAMLNNYTGIIHIANCLNRIHFGNTATGGCSNPGNNSVFGVTLTTTSSNGPVTSSTTLPSGFSQTACASENGTCSFTGILQVAYGATGGWKFMSAANGTACNNNVFGDPTPGIVKACYTRPDPTGWSPPAQSGAQTTDTFFYTRVSVCNVDGNGLLLDPRPDLCLRYPSGKYKPVGNLQKYSDRIRVAAFGYLNDPTGNPKERYGGVLRAPMKYVGPTYYDANFTLIPGANPNQEWDSTTGVFLVNPDGNSTVPSGPSNAGPYLSGVTNYLNQFGRTGTFGQYKTYDPVGELYYESLRYLQGLPITPQAVYGMTTTMQDGFPVTTTWTDPHPPVAGMSTTSTDDYACVRNNIVAIGDANTHNDKSFPGNTYRLTNESDNSGLGFPSGRVVNVTGNEPDFYTWTQVVGAFESGGTLGYLDGKGISRTTSNFNPPNSALANMQTLNIGADGAAYFIAGAAYWANTHDIRGANWTSWPTATDPRRPGMRVSTYILDVNEGAAQNNATTRYKNQFFIASKYGGFNDVTGTGNPFLAVDGTNTNSNWQDPSNPGEANNYYLSSSAANVLAGLNQIFAKIASQSNSIAGGATSSQQLTSAPGAVYQAQFDSTGWSGDVNAYASGLDSNGNPQVANTSSWSAAAELNAKLPNNRNIVIGKTTPTAATAATNFMWNNVDADVQTALLAPPYSATGTAADPLATGQARLDFLRGDRSNETPSGLRMRKRQSALGDIINSGLVFSGAPTQSISDSAYQAFYNANASRRRALFVGANDGMLHAFDPDNGTSTGAGHTGGNELFAYIPSWMIPKLGALTSPSYVHQNYVDATPVVAEAKVGTTYSSATWKTVLVGGTGGGGQGVYALDVTDPAAFDASKVLWEFTDRDDADLGNVIGRPQILKIRSNAISATGAADYQYFAVFASGVDNYVNDGRYSSTGKPAIFILDLSKPTGTPWSLGSNYFKVSFPTATATASGMVGFTATLGTADALSAIYAGDLQGNVWKLDFTKAVAGKTDWNLGKLSYYVDASNNPIPMYVAKSATGVLQPITMEPTLVYGANRSIIVTFGTGKYLESSDNVVSGAPQQSVYAILDNNSATPDSGSSSTSAIAGRGRLAQGIYSATSGSVTVPAFTYGRSLSNTDTSGVRSGWYFDFGNAGERQINAFTVLPGRLYFGSLIPALNSCLNGGGNIYSVSIATGNATFTASTVGTPAQIMVLQVGSSTSTATDTTGTAAKTTRYQVVVQGTGGTSAIGGSAGLSSNVSFSQRLSWREISNYQLLRNQ